MVITREIAASKLADYLRHNITPQELVEWAESALLEGNFEEKSAPVLAAVLARIGVADVKAFGLSWDDCESLLHQLGYNAKVEIEAA